MITRNYKMLYWENKPIKTRVIICDDLPNIVQICIDSFGSITELLERDDVHRLFYESGYNSFLILDSVFNEETVFGNIVRSNQHQADQWCKIKPAFNLEDYSQRIIVWSGSKEEKHPFLRWYTKSNNEVHDLKLIKYLYEETVAGNNKVEDWPLKLINHEKTPELPEDVLRGVLHSLDNALGPISNDLDTLSNCSIEPHEINEIYLAYFSSEGAYVNDRNELFKYPNILEVFKSNLQKLEAIGINDSELNDASIDFTSTVHQLLKSTISPTPESLKVSLESVSIKGSVIVKRLRILRYSELIKATIHDLINNPLVPIETDIKYVSQSSLAPSLIKEINFIYFSQSEEYYNEDNIRIKNNNVLNLFASHLGRLGAIIKEDFYLENVFIDFSSTLKRLGESLEIPTPESLKVALEDVLKKGTAIVCRLCILLDANKVCSADCQLCRVIKVQKT